MSLPLRKSAQSAVSITNDAIPAPYVPISVAAVLMGLAERTLRLRCQDEWESTGLAKKFDAAGWGILPIADRRLRAERDCITDDLQAIAQLRAKGISRDHIELAEARRNLLLDFDRFRLAHGDLQRPKMLRLFIGHCQSVGTIGPASTIRKLARSQLYEWIAAYKASGLHGLVRKQREQLDSVAIGKCAWADFLHRKGKPGDPKLKDCWKLTSAVAETHAANPDWAWPSYTCVRLRYNRTIHPATRHASTFGPHKTEARFFPKITRCLEDIAAGSVLVGDERIMDFVVRVPCAVGWKLARPKLTAWIDCRSRYFVGWKLEESANSDTIHAALKLSVLATGTLPDEVNIDNGEDYRSVAGRSKRQRKWDEFDAGRVSGAFERLGIVRHFAKVRTPWAKMIESHFSRVKDRLDRHMPTFCGGAPGERPYDLYKHLEADIISVPTMEEARRQVAEFFESLHEEVIGGDGMGNLSPRQALRQFFTQSPRLVPAETLDVMCCRMHGPVKVGRDGVRHRSIRYGKWDEAVFDLQGRELFFLEDPESASFITLCDERGVPICKAFADNNLGQTPQEVRQAENVRKSARRRLKRTHDDQLAALQSTTETVAELRARAARAKQIADADLPVPPPPETLRVVRADAEPAIEQVKIAAGSSAIRRLKELNAGAAALNQRAQRRPRFADLTSELATAAPKFTARLSDLETDDES